MSGIFVSHSSSDNAIAEEFGRWLAADGYGPVFLDAHPDDGIPAGADWEATLYEKLRTCRVLVLLCSAASMRSQWCFAEFVLVRSAGKLVIPVRVDDCQVHESLHRLQVVDWVTQRDTARNRLRRSLAAAGIESVDRFGWDGSRPPYPGLYAFEESDRPVFFGRDDEVWECIEALNRTRLSTGSRMALVLGASGTGKSSLVRAGVAPRLRREADRWVVVGPFRPGQDPLRRLSQALVRAAGGVAEAASSPAEQVYVELQTSMRAGGIARAGTMLLERARALTVRAIGEAPTVAVVIDQFEELLARQLQPLVTERAATGPADAFLGLLRAAIDRSASLPEAPLVVVATLRSDFLAAFQQQPALGGLRRETVQVDPIGSGQLHAIIEKPALVAGFSLEPGLVDEILRDIGSPDALPLLAFTLHRLWTKRGQEGRLTVDSYRELGGLERSVAQDAERTVRAFPEVSDDDLRYAFLAMVRVNDEQQVVRRPEGAHWDGLPEPVRPLLEELVQRRLLVARGDKAGRKTVEIAHEALVRNWERLRRWLDEDREFLLWRKRLDVARELWDSEAPDDGGALWGAQLDEAQRWLEERGPALSDAQRAFIQSSIDLRRRQAEAQRREEAQRRRLEWEARQNLAGLYAQKAETARQDGDLRAAQVYYAAALANHPSTGTAAVAASELGPEAAKAASEQLARFRSSLNQCRMEAWETFHRTIPEIPDRTGLLAFTPDGRILALDARGCLRCWDPETGASFLLLPDPLDRHHRFAYSAADGLLAAVDWDDNVSLYSTTERALIGRRSLPGYPSSLAFVPRKGLLLQEFWDAEGNASMVRVWSVPDLQAVGVLTSDRSMYQYACSADGELVAVAETNVHLWDTTTLNRVAVLPASSYAIRALDFASGSGLLATAGVDQTVRVWRTAWPAGSAAPAPVVTLQGHRVTVEALRFSPDGRHLASAAADGARLWRVDDGGTIAVLPASRAPVRFSPDGRLLVTDGEDGTRVWRVAEARPAAVLRGSAQPVFSPDGRWLVTRRGTQGVAVWTAAHHPAITLAGHTNTVRSVAFSPVDNDVVASAAWVGGGPTVRIWSVERATTVVDSIPCTAPMRSVAFSRDGTVVACTGDDGLVRVHHVSGHQMCIFEEPLSPGQAFEQRLAELPPEARTQAEQDRIREEQRLEVVGAVAVSPQGDLVASSGRDGSVRLWSMVLRRLVFSLRSRQLSRVNALAFSPDGALLAAAGDAADNAIRVWRIADRAEVHTLPGHSHMVDTLAFSPDGGLLASGSLDKTVMLWDVRSGTLMWALPQHDHPIGGVAFSPDGRLLASVENASSGSGHSRKLRYWDLGSGHLLLEVPFRQDLNAVSFAPDGLSVAVAAGNDVHVLQVPHDLLLAEEANEVLDQAQRVAGLVLQGIDAVPGRRA